MRRSALHPEMMKTPRGGTVWCVSWMGLFWCAWSDTLGCIHYEAGRVIRTEDGDENHTEHGACSCHVESN